MSNTEKVYERFWATMGERYGVRWFDAYGNTPTTAWRDLLQAYTPRDVLGAIQLLDGKQSTREHPPTEPEFRALLKQAARASVKLPDEPGELRRGYWRSCIVRFVCDGFGESITGFERLLVANKTSLGRACKDLLDDLDELEGNSGQRTPGQLAVCERRCREIVDAFIELRAAVPA